MMERRRIWAFEYGTLWANDPGAAPHAPVVPRRAVAYREAHPDDVLPLAEAMGERDHTLVEQRFAGARRCFAAWDGSRIAAYGWASQGHEYVGEMERTFRLQTGEAYIWDCATLPEYRGQRLYSALLDYMVAELRRAGVGRVWIGASLDNRPSIKGFVNAGFQPAITLVYARLLGLRCGWVRGCNGAPGWLVAAATLIVVADGERALGPLIVGVG